MGRGKLATGVKVHRVSASLWECTEATGLPVHLVQVDSTLVSELHLTYNLNQESIYRAPFAPNACLCYVHVHVLPTPEIRTPAAPELVRFHCSQPL